MFWDLRGFSGKVEAAAESLLPILERVSRALGVMSRCILDHGGVVADFLGDCAMGFWGWPLRNEDDITRACQAALSIRETKSSRSTPTIRCTSFGPAWALPRVTPSPGRSAARTRPRSPSLDRA